MPLDAFKPYLKALETQLRAGHASERSRGLPARGGDLASNPLPLATA
jgi:hypothetical protein